MRIKLNTFLLCIGLGLAFAADCVSITPNWFGDDKKAAMEAVKQFHDLYNDGKLELAYEFSHPDARKVFEDDKLADSMRIWLQAFGKVEESELVSSDEQSVDGYTSVRLTYNTKYERLNAIEKFVWYVNGTEVLLYNHSVSEDMGDRPPGADASVGPDTRIAYKDPEFPFEIKYSKYWKQTPPGGEGISINLDFERDTLWANFSINGLETNDIPANTTEEWVDSMLATPGFAEEAIMKGMEGMPGAAFVDSSKIEVNKRWGFASRVAITGVRNGVNSEFVVYFVQLSVDGIFYTLTFGTEKRFYDEMKPEFDKIVNSFVVEGNHLSFINNHLSGRN